MTPNLRATLHVCLALCVYHIAPCIHAQTAPANPESVLQSQLVGQRFILHNMSGATKISGTWDGHVATLDPPPWHELATLTVRSIKLKGDKVHLKATRNQLWESKSGALVIDTYGTPVELTLTLQGDPAALAPTLRDAIFFTSLTAATAAIPEAFRAEIFLTPVVQHTLSKPSGCDCADPPGTCTAVEHSGYEHPTVLRQVEPEFSNEARDLKISGSLLVGLYVDDSGAIKDEWLLGGLGYGLDEEAALAVSKYKFGPATCHDKPLATILYVNVTFIPHPRPDPM
ncbi:MAG: energy transducer TonB [Acidobacteriaceae bacterium]